MGLPDGSVGKESALSAGDPGSIPGSGRSTGEGRGYPLQYSWASLVAQLLRILLQCRRPGLNPWVGKIPWRRERLPTPVFWPGEFHGLYSPWGRKESDTTERLSLSKLGKNLSFTLSSPLCQETVLPLAGVLAQAAITEYQRLEGLNNRHVISLSIRV